MLFASKTLIRRRSVAKLSIGILGHNEEYGIAHLLDSLHDQTLLNQCHELEIVVISNGSHDNMAAVARSKLVGLKGIKHQVVELSVADKCGAWNHFIHRAAQPSDYYILLDADVVLVHSAALEDLVQPLIQHPMCRICGGIVVNLKGEIVNHWIDGKCYAIRGEIARNIYIPPGIVLDDAYVAATAITNWYETDQDAGERKGYTSKTERITVRCGVTPRDRNKSYWIACRKRTITAEYTQRHVDYCMRFVFGGGELAKTISMKLSTLNPNWFTEYLNQVSVKDAAPRFNPPKIHLPFSMKQVAQFMVYCYCYLLSTVGIRNREFGHLAWKLKHRYW